MIKNLIKPFYRIFVSLFFDPFEFIKKLRGLPLYLSDLFLYKKAQNNTVFPAKFSNIYPILNDRFELAGTASGIYFLQDLWAAKYLYDNNIRYHVDVGSRIDGFIAHILPFCQVEYVDIRSLQSKINNLKFRKGSITDLPFNSESIKSLSCLHVIEHIGLGRYGDPIDPSGYLKGAKELSRVLAHGGLLLLSTPVGKEKLYFNAHRVFDPYTIIKIFDELKLIEFNFIDDKGEKIIHNADLKDATKYTYGCGLFVFTKD